MYVNCRLTTVVLLVAVTIYGQRAWAGPAEDQYAIASDHYAHQRWQLAIEEFRAFLRDYPSHANADSALFFLAESQVQFRQWADAAESLDRFLAAYTDHQLTAKALFRRGEVAYLTQDDQPARRILWSFRDRYPRDPLNAFALPYLGEIALRQNQWEQAQTVFSRALDQYPQGALAAQCRFGLARAMERSGDDQSALRFYEFLARDQASPLADDALLAIATMQVRQQRFDAALGTLADFDTRFPQSNLALHARYWMGMAHGGKQQWSTAAETFRRVLDEQLDDRLAPAVTFAAAEALEKNAEPAAARSYYQQVFDKWPRSDWADDALQATIQLAVEQGDVDPVERLANQFFTEYPESSLVAVVRRSLGRSLLKQERFDEAAAQFESLLATDETPQDRAVDQYYLALACLGAKRFDAALDQLQQASLGTVPAGLQAGLLSAQASALIETGRPQQAIVPLEQYLREHGGQPDAPKCFAQLVNVLVGQGQLDQAQRTLDEYRRLHPQDAGLFPAIHAVADAAREAGRVEIAAALYQSLAEAEHSQQWALVGLLGLGGLRMKTDPIEAAEVFRKIVERFPHSDRACEAELLLAKALTEANQTEQALQVYQQILQRQPSGSTMFSVMHQAARLHQSAGHTDEAVQLLHRIATDGNEYEHLDAVLYEWGWALADLDRHEEADAAFGDLARRFPDSDYRGHALYRLAQRAARDQKFDDARQLLVELIGQNCEARILVPALYLKGQTEANAGNWAAVVPPMRRVLDNFPDSDLAVPARYWVAESHFRLGDYDRADELFDSLQLETEDREDAWLAMVPLRRAQILAHRGTWREARDSAESVLARYPQFVQRFEVEYLLGRCYVAEADFERARESFEAVIRSPAGGRTETAAMAQWMIGESYLQQKNYAEAIKAYHRVEVLFPFPRWQAAALLQAGKCHELLGQWRESIGLYDQLIKEYPNTQFVDDASQRIRVARQRQMEASAQR